MRIWAEHSWWREQECMFPSSCPRRGEDARWAEGCEWGTGMVRKECVAS